MFTDLRPDWQHLGSCVGEDPALFFPRITQRLNRLELYALEEAFTICARCPVAVQCAEYAEEQKAVGVWAGRLRPLT